MRLMQYLGFVLVSFVRIAVCLLWDAEYLTNIIEPLFTIGQMQELIWFVSEHATAEVNVALTPFMSATINTLGATQMVLSNRSDLRITTTTNRKNSLGVVFATGPDDAILDVHHNVMRGRHFYFNVIIATHVIDDFHVVESYVDGIWNRSFVNTLIYYRDSKGSNELFGYGLYPEYKVENRSNLFGYMFRSMKKVLYGGGDVEGYKFYTPMRQDLPGVIRYKNRHGHLALQGTAYLVLQLFVDYMNGTLVEREMPAATDGGEAIDMRAALQLVRTREVEVLVHAYALFEIDEEIDKSYPILVVRWCLMVPLLNSLSTYYYTLQPFHAYVWYAWIATFLIYLVIDFARILTLDGLVRGLAQYRLVHALGVSFLNNFCLFINIATMATIRVPAPLRFLVYVTLFFYGFFISANYTSLLGSILTVTLFRTQINTLDDVIAANMSVMIIDYEKDFLLSEDNELPASFLALLRAVDVGTFTEHQNGLNTSFAYFVTDDKWHFLNLQQKHLRQRHFKLTDICFGSYHLAFPMPAESPLWRNVEYYMYRVHSSGLYEHFESTAFDYAVHAGLLRRFDETLYTSAGMQHFLMVFTMLAVFCGVAFVILLLECFVYHLTLSKSTRRDVQTPQRAFEH